ncbi:MAG: ABC transporter ATP-binding protein [Burkholderiaceae bacterium]
MPSRPIGYLTGPDLGAFLKNITLTVDGMVHIHDTSLELSPGGFNVLLGTTLAGKTSLMRLMAGLIRPTSGEVWFDGRDVTGVPVQKRNVSMVYQQFINYPNFSVFDNIASPLRVAGLKADAIKARVGPIAELLRLTPFLARRPSELSGGQQQRCAMARALVKDSDLVLFDEPLANLDYKLREELRDELPRLFADRQCTVVYATTEPAEALLLGGQTATLHQGRVTQFGPGVQVYRQPVDVTTARVFSDPPINTVNVTKRGDRIHLSDTASWPVPGALAALTDGAYQLGIRPHHVVPLGQGAGAAMVEGRVLVTEISGSESTVHFDMAGQPWVSLSHGVHPFDAGATARFHVDVSRALYFAPDGALVHA